MYIPKVYQGDKDLIPDFIRKFPFGIVASAKNEKVSASHLPFVLHEKEGKFLLLSHISIANKQWEEMKNKEVLVIFSEPHSYISPELYSQQQNVPTWNYIALHIYGTVQINKKQEEILDILHKSIHFFEEKYQIQWEALDETYKEKLLSKIVGLTITVNEIQFSEKLSQDKSEKDRMSVLNALKDSGDTSAQHIADGMEKQLKKTKKE